MRAVDTNVLVRVLTGDDAEQLRRARGLFERETIWIAKTVLLEMNWVLRHKYGYAPEQVQAGIRGLLGLPGVAFEDRLEVEAALAMVEAGLDFADALHLACTPADAIFATFDERLVRKPRRQGWQAVDV